MSREKRRFSIGSAHNATCATSKRWGASIWHTIKWPSPSWRQSLAQTFIRQRKPYRKEGNRHETVYAKNRVVSHAGCVSLRRHVLLKGRCHWKTKQRRLLHLHDALVGAFEGSRQVSHLLDGSRARDEEGGRRSYAPTPRRSNERRREKGAERRNARDARHARHERGRDEGRRKAKRIRRSSRTSAADWRALRKGGAQAAAPYHSCSRPDCAR